MWVQGHSAAGVAALRGSEEAGTGVWTLGVRLPHLSAAHVWAGTRIDWGAGSPNLTPRQALGVPLLPTFARSESLSPVVYLALPGSASPAHQSLTRPGQWGPPLPSSARCGVRGAHLASSGNRPLLVPLADSHVPRTQSPDPCQVRFPFKNLGDWYRLMDYPSEATCT